MFRNALCILLAWSSRKSVSKLRMLPHGPYIAQLLEGNYSSNAARSRITTNLQQEVRDYVYRYMYPKKYTLIESISNIDSHSSTSGEEELDDSEDDR